jgi:hypothetical protein
MTLYSYHTYTQNAHLKTSTCGVDTIVRRTGEEGLERTEMVRETDTTWLPDASEDRVIEWPVCSNAMTAEGVTVDVLLYHRRWLRFRGPNPLLDDREVITMEGLIGG